MKKFFKRTAIILLILIGLILVFNRQLQGLFVSHLTDAKWEQVTKKNIDKGKKGKGDFNFSKVKSIGAYEIAKGSTGNFSVMGGISVPSVGVKLPIGKGVSQSVLVKGAGTMKPDEQMGQGNYALAGHHVRDRYILFTPLVDVKMGASIYLTDLSHVYKYKIYSKKVIQPTKVDIIDDVKGKKIVTLITCAEQGTKRWGIQGELVSTKKANKDTLKVFDR